jgi:hypothetical protein
MKEDREHEFKARVLLVAETTNDPQMLALIVALGQYVRPRMPSGDTNRLAAHEVTLHTFQSRRYIICVLFILDFVT